MLIHLSLFTNWVIMACSFFSRTILSLSVISTKWDMDVIGLNYRNGNSSLVEYFPSVSDDHPYSVMYMIIIDISNQ